MQLSAKKVKEIKGYAKNDVKWFVKRKREVEKDAVRFPAGKEEFNKRYPKGITSYYEELVGINEQRKERLKNQFGYTDETLKERAEIYHEAFWSSWKWWNNKMLEIDTVMAKYKPIFQEAEEVAKKVDVSDIKDGFPCGMALLYLKPEAKKTDLGKALRLMSNSDSYSAKVCHWSAYQLPVRIPTYGQCMTFYTRICGEVAEFLDSKGIPTGVYSMID